MITWLASYPKSGNTWVRALIDAYLRDQPVDINNMHGTDSDVNPKWFQNLTPVPLHMMQEEHRLLLRPAGLFNISMMNRTPFALKTHCMHCAMAGMPMFPEGTIKRVIQIVRDPRDVAISLADHLGKDIDTAIEIMNQPLFVLTGKNLIPSPIGDWRSHYLTWQQAADRENFPITLIKYEHLMEHTREVFRFMLEAWEQPIDMERINRAVNRASFDRLRSEEERSGFRDKSEHSERFFRAGYQQQWRSKLTVDQITRIEQTQGDVMQELGYHVTMAAAPVA